MSGNTKKVLYAIFFCICGLFAVAGGICMLYFAMQANVINVRSLGLLLFLFAVVSLLLPLNVLLHEGGHLIFGFLAGFRFVSFSVSYFELSRQGLRFLGRSPQAGKTVMLPRRPNGVRSKTIFCALGGAVFNFIYGIVFLTLYFVVPQSPVLLFFELFVPINFFEGLLSLYPIVLGAGKTDGAVVAGLLKKNPEAEVMLAVTTAQGMLYQKRFSELPENLLFDLPVIREDDRAFWALMQLRWQYLFMQNDFKNAVSCLCRLESVTLYMSVRERAEISCDLAYAYGVILGDDDRAKEFFDGAEEAKGTTAYFRSAYAICGSDEPSASKAIAKIKMKGIRELEERMVEVGKEKNNSAENAEYV